MQKGWGEGGGGRGPRRVREMLTTPKPHSRHPASPPPPSRWSNILLGWTNATGAVLSERSHVFSNPFFSFIPTVEKNIYISGFIYSRLAVSRVIAGDNRPGVNREEKGREGGRERRLLSVTLIQKTHENRQLLPKAPVKPKPGWCVCVCV